MARLRGRAHVEEDEIKWCPRNPALFYIEGHLCNAPTKWASWTTRRILIRKMSLENCKHLACAPSYLYMWPTIEQMYICVGSLVILGSLNVKLLLTSGFGSGCSTDKCSPWFVSFVWSGVQKPEAAPWRTGLPKICLEFSWRSCKWCDSLAWTLQPRSWSRWISLKNHCWIFFFISLLLWAEVFTHLNINYIEETHQN